MKSDPVRIVSKRHGVSRLSQPLSLFVARRLLTGITELPAVELVEEEIENARAQPLLKFFDDQCGCN